jgi:hypothetical protein
MNWKHIVDQYIQGERAGLEMIDQLANLVLENPSMESEVVQYLREHGNDGVSSRVGTLQEWVKMSRDAGA